MVEIIEIRASRSSEASTYIIYEDGKPPKYAVTSYKDSLSVSINLGCSRGARFSSPLLTVSPGDSENPQVPAELTNGQGRVDPVLRQGLMKILTKDESLKACVKKILG